RMPRSISVNSSTFTGPAALRNFNPAYVRFGSFATVGTFPADAACPLHPLKRTNSRCLVRSASCQKRTRALQQKKWLFDHLVGAGEAVLGGVFRARGPENVGGLRRFAVAISSRRGSAGGFPSRKPPRGGRGSLPQSRQFGDQKFRSKKSARLHHTRRPGWRLLFSPSPSAAWVANFCSLSARRL